MTQLTEYELERLANIERNQAILQSLGIFQAEVGPSKVKKEAEERAAAARERRQSQQQQKKKAKKWNPLDTPPAATRRSSRISNPSSRSTRRSTRENINSDPIDFLSHPASSPLKKRTPVRLRPRPSTPARRPVYIESSSDEDTKKDDGEYEDDENIEEVNFPRQPLPIRDENGNLYFADEPGFVPNMTPEEMLREGSFGGTAFCLHRSSLTKHLLPESDYTEFPESWFEDLDISRSVTSVNYDPLVNRYGVKAGQSLSDWEKNGWIHSQDPRGWFQWYCRFYLGRRTRDDDRQIKRWLGVCGPVGRFKKSLIKKITVENGQWDDEEISPVVRQTLQHWGYRLTKEDYEAYLYTGDEQIED